MCAHRETCVWARSRGSQSRILLSDTYIYSAKRPAREQSWSAIQLRVPTTAVSVVGYAEVEDQRHGLRLPTESLVVTDLKALPRAFVPCEG